MSIKPLNKQTIKLINSTQVITSVYSVVKELVENSLDAEAKNIEVNLVENGLSLIEVKDNGLGINKEDAQFMGLPSYTSKITDFNDLDLLSTYGFRGEGLTAVCQVSDVIVCTKTIKDETVTRYTLDNEGHIISSEMSHGSCGTTVQAKNLFKNMPVRRNILTNKKRISQEIKAVEILLKTYAICKPGLRFLFRVNSNTVFMKPNCKNITEAIKSVLGVQIFSKLTCIEQLFDKTAIQLFIPKKEIKDGAEISQVGLQFICVNDRPIKSNEIEKKIKKRLSDYFDPSSTHSRKYIFCLVIKVEPSMLDVNLEPNKDKVFLHNEASILNQLDNILLGFYGLQDSQMSTQHDIENMNIHGNINESEKRNGELTEMPLVKKRKLDVQSKNDNDINTTNKNEETLVKSNIDFLESLKPPVLSDSDSNDGFNAINEKTENRKDLQAMDIDDSPDFDFSDILKKTEIEKIEESLSQLPVVDLGEDFSWHDIVNKCNTKLKESEENCSKELDKQKISNLAWSKGQVPGLQGGVSVAILNNETNTTNCKIENNQNQDSEMFDIGNDVDRIHDNEVQTAKNDSEIKEFHWDMAFKNPKKSSSNVNKPSTSKTSTKRKSIVDDPNQTTIPFAGDNACLTTLGPSAFSMYCTAARIEILKQNPDLTPAEVAVQLNKQWKQTSLEEREYYRNLANEKRSNNNPLPDPNVPKKPKTQLTQEETEKNRKKLVNMLGNMKTNMAEIKNQSMIMRAYVSCDTSLTKVTQKFRKLITKELPTEEIEKSIVVGALNSLLWIVKLKSSLCVVDITEIQAQLHINGYDMAQINGDYVDSLVKRFIKEKTDMTIFHPIHSFQKT